MWEEREKRIQKFCLKMDQQCLKDMGVNMEYARAKNSVEAGLWYLKNETKRKKTINKGVK